jgi:alanyl aminopeptidase
LENYFGTKYPYEKLDLIAVPEYWFGAMENPGAITFNDKILLIDPAAASLAQKRSVAMVTMHELAHMWFGDLVTMSWWDDLWLNESFADWLAMKLMPEMFPDYRYETTEVGEVNQIMMSDARPSTVPVRRKVDSGADIEEDLGLAYEKGRTVLRMTEEFIAWLPAACGLNAHKWGMQSTDLFSALAGGGQEPGAALEQLPRPTRVSAGQGRRQPEWTDDGFAEAVLERGCESRRRDVDGSRSTQDLGREGRADARGRVGQAVD